MQIYFNIKGKFINCLPNIIDEINLANCSWESVVEDLSIAFRDPKKSFNEILNAIHSNTSPDQTVRFKIPR